MIKLLRRKASLPIYLLKGYREIAPKILAITITQTIPHTISRCSTIILGPGTIPNMRKAPNKMAIPLLPGIPKTSVGNRAPPSLELLALSGAVCVNSQQGRSP